MKKILFLFVAVLTFGSIIGYFVSDGKPASTQSYLTPEYTFVDDIDLGEHNGSVLVEAPDIDGCYGANSPGLRFFTADGFPIELTGNLGLMYSAVPITAFNVPQLYTSPSK